MEEVIKNTTAQWGAIGLLIIVLLAANAVQWRRALQRDEEFARLNSELKEVAIACVTVNTEMVTLIRDRGRG